MFARSLGLVMGALFDLSWLAQSITRRAAYNAQQSGPTLVRHHSTTGCHIAVSVGRWCPFFQS